MHSCLDTYGTLIPLTFIFNDNSCKILYTDNKVRLEESATESNSFYTHMLFSFVHSYRAWNDEKLCRVLWDLYMIGEYKKDKLLLIIDECG